MWCPNCKADVAAEVTPDNRRIHCATCGVEIAASPRAGLAKTREARDLLERWASERKSDAPSRRTGSTARSVEKSVAREAIAEEWEADTDRSTEEPASSKAEIAPARAPKGETAKSNTRVDMPRPAAAAAPDETSSQTSVAASSANVRASRGVVRSEPGRNELPRIHRQHETAAAVPHFEIQSSIVTNERRRTNWSTVVGHLLAYAGVALLTVGSTLIIWGYFGGPAMYAPTGWLTATGGQMMLLLGIVTLVSGGLEQTNEEVKMRIERLGERFIRIEQIARDQALRGPTLPAEYFGPTGPPSAVGESGRPSSETIRS